MRWLFLKDLQILRRSPLLVALLVIYPVVIALLIGFALIAAPFLGIFALGLGLGDTWMDWRRRPRPTT